MAPKKDDKKGGKGGKGKQEEAKPPAALSEVEKTLFELQIVELNRKLARLRTTADDYEVRNEELQKAYDKLDEDRADIIAYLKKTLNIKTEECIELKDKVKGLEELREIETAQFKETVNELEKNFTLMKDQLTSENKLLAGKLNTLEEFRAIRDDLMKKFERQEQEFKDQEMKYKRIIYEAEKKFVIGKDKLKKEMEARLLQLAQDFQDATELRIAASTHRVIRENIAINNELDNILATQAKLAEQNERYRESEKEARAAKEVAEEERDTTINKNIIQLKVIGKLSDAFQEVKKERAIFEKKTFDIETLQEKLQKCSKDNETLSLQVRILEQNLHARLSEQNKTVIETSKMAKEAQKLRKILKEAAFAIQAALKLDQWATVDPTRDIMDRQVLLSRLLNIVTQYREIQRAESMDTVASYGAVYEEGDLGFIPKPTKKKSPVSAVITDAKDKEREKESVRGDSTTVSSESLGSVKTIPSVRLVPPSSVPDLVPKDSIESFVTSTKSSVSSSEAVEEEELFTEMEKKLEASKLEIQKSIIKDLAYSQARFKSLVALQSQGRLSEDKQGEKSAVIVEGVEREKLKEEKQEGEQQEVPQQEGEGTEMTEEPEKTEDTEKSPEEAAPEEEEK